MKITFPLTMTDDNVTSTNLSEDAAYSAYNAGTTYNLGDYAYLVSTHKLYQSTQASNLGNDPASDDGTWWVEASDTNAWKCLRYNGGSSTVADSASGIAYTFTVDAECSDIGFKGLKSSGVTVTVKNASAVTVYTSTKTGTETKDNLSWYIDQMIFEDIGAQVDFTVDVTVSDPSGAAVAECGQIILGYTHSIGQVIEGTSVGFDDFSVREQDEFGDFTVTARGVADTADFQFVHLETSSRHVKDVLIDARAQPCLFWQSENLINMGLFVCGYSSEPVTEHGTTKSITTFDVMGIGYDVNTIVEFSPVV